MYVSVCMWGGGGGGSVYVSLCRCVYVCVSVYTTCCMVFSLRRTACSSLSKASLRCRSFVSASISDSRNRTCTGKHSVTGKDTALQARTQRYWQGLSVTGKGTALQARTQRYRYRNGITDTHRDTLQVRTQRYRQGHSVTGTEMVLLTLTGTHYR